MGIFQRLFSRKSDKEEKRPKDKGTQPGYLACPVVASELKRGKLDSVPEEKSLSGDTVSGKSGENSAEEKS